MKNINIFGQKPENSLDCKKTNKTGFKALCQKTKDAQAMARLMFKISLNRALAY
jgi:hypothetical protein